MNLLSVHTKKGLYVLAYLPVKLNVKERTLLADQTPVLCRESIVEGERVSARQFLDEEEMSLLDDFSANAETIRNAIMMKDRRMFVDDMPYLLEMGRKNLLDLPAEYAGIHQQYAYDQVTVPLQAFFGKLTAHPKRRKSVPFALTDLQVNLDQLLAMNHAMRYPVSYVQGPPGTGKTATIAHIIITAFFNNRTVLFSSYNNHPIDEAVGRIRSLQYAGNEIPIPCARLGNQEEVMKTLEEIDRLYTLASHTPVYEKTLDKNYAERNRSAKELTALLEQYERRVDLLERKEAIETMIQSAEDPAFALRLEAGQKAQVEAELKKIPEISMEDVMPLLEKDREGLEKYLYFTSIRHIRKIGDRKNSDLYSILSIPEKEDRVKEFNKWLKESDHLLRFLEIFPILATTCISASRLGQPEPNFDLVIMDEASQCNPAVSLVPIVRGKNLLLVGDPQQLQPVIQLNETDNLKLRKQYRVTDAYDYISNSIYKTYLASDPVSDEILLSFHYRCDPKIIGFNNKKYYNNRLKMKGKAKNEKPLVFMDVAEDKSVVKNTAPKEVDAMLDFIQNNGDKSIGIITPFVRQRELIEERIGMYNLPNVDCGTVHAFQGDQKDIILFSLALTDATRAATYAWLKNNRELINVAVSRAKEQLVLVGSKESLDRLHEAEEPDDLFELAEYIESEGESEVSDRHADSRALGIRPYSTEIEAAFLENLNHALSTAYTDARPYVIHKEVPISQVFLENTTVDDYFYKGRFDFVVYRRSSRQEIPVLAIELDGQEHFDEDIVRKRDEKKNAICEAHGFSLIRVENCYARRYHYMKDILMEYFRGR